MELTTLYYDNIFAIIMKNNLVFHAWIKHIDINCPFIRENIASKEITGQQIHTEDHIVDAFTKYLPNQQLCNLRYKLMV